MTILTVILPGLANGHFRLELFSIANIFAYMLYNLRETVLKEVTTMWRVPLSNSYSNKTEKCNVVFAKGKRPKNSLDSDKN